MTTMQDRYDLGAINGAVMVFGGPYGNLQATQALRKRAEELGVPPERIICTGDVAAYCAEPQAVVDTLREWGVHVLMGNCEESLADDADDCGCGFAVGSQCAILSEDWYGYCRKALSTEARAWMGVLPRRIHLQLGPWRAAVIHGGAEILNRFIFASTPIETKREEVAHCDADLVIAGHCGIPFTQFVDGAVWHNPGVIGMPANDGSSEVWWGLLQVDSEGRLRIEHQRLRYDHLAAQESMRRNGLHNGYARALSCGLWPSMDVLPPTERAQQGAPLSFPAEWVFQARDACDSADCTSQIV
ncbi:Diadenosine tetraphosphatase and related serine/threonine protein phosphatase [Hahella chejuensis KCTC 2396]|uniref:Diadenosine tetraphosphatase and related serine/threonine protein phosphatase n=1 Tax=Hahella chejuensis (strain KCTC 2396) TaxID=349521 RepID=Q2S7Q3_HAHCH|nr:metallophosphoesterase family protein [Hahella chejuensis]ABC33321.1 Diadenosine tetraphosphatase and related serine/threonine protein phosphatase [Hahella chejuensis KCTC 2396]